MKHDKNHSYEVKKMKKILVSFMILFFFSFQSVDATLLSTQYPGGKNYLDALNFNFSEGSISTIDSIKVKPNTYYTLTIPSSDMIGDPMIFIYGNEDYIIGDPSLNGCSVSSTITCTFFNVDDFIDIEINSSLLGLYDSYYGFEVFQLEEGQLSTSFEYYIEPLQDTRNPEFNNTGAYITDYNDISSIEEIVSSHVTAIDEIDGDISDKIVIVEDNYSQYKGIIGEYNVLLEVEDSSFNKASFTLVIIVKDQIPPVIEGPDSIEVDVDALLSIDFIISNHYLITDEYDGPLGYTILEDTYTDYMTQVGSYTVTFDTVDSSLNIHSKTITLHVKDYDSPILVSSNQYQTSVDSIETIDTIINNLEITDNYDSIVSRQIILDNYTGNEQTIGTYFVTFEAIDSSNNISEFTISISVYDSIPPSLSGPSQIQISYTETLTLEDIKQLLNPQDNHSVLTYDDIIVNNDTYTIRQEETGVFQVTFSVSDHAGLSATHLVEITIIDDQLPVIFVDDYIVKINPEVTFTNQDALYLLLRSKELQEGDYEMNTLINEYTGNEKIPGMYLYQVSFTNQEGDTYIKDFVIEVLKEDQDINLLPIISFTALLMTFSIYVIIKRKK